MEVQPPEASAVEHSRQSKLRLSKFVAKTLLAIALESKVWIQMDSSKTKILDFKAILRPSPGIHWIQSGKFNLLH